jgi:hypothetical protein
MDKNEIVLIYPKYMIARFNAMLSFFFLGKYEKTSPDEMTIQLRGWHKPSIKKEVNYAFFGNQTG